MFPMGWKRVSWVPWLRKCISLSRVENSWWVMVVGRWAHLVWCSCRRATHHIHTYMRGGKYGMHWRQFCFLSNIFLFGLICCTYAFVEAVTLRGEWLYTSPWYMICDCIFSMKYSTHIHLDLLDLLVQHDFPWRWSRGFYNQPVCVGTCTCSPSLVTTIGHCKEGK